MVHTYYYTDPICPWSWAMEPALRKLAVEFPDAFSVTYVMCGMAREVGDTAPLVSEMLEAADRSGMPVDARLWLLAPPRSSYPACLAVKAAAEQGDPGPYLRRVREGLMCRRRKLDTADALVEEARAVPGLGAVCDLPGPRAPAELWRLALEWRVRPERLGTGQLWSLT